MRHLGRINVVEKLAYRRLNEGTPVPRTEHSRDIFNTHDTISMESVPTSRMPNTDGETYPPSTVRELERLAILSENDHLTEENKMLRRSLEQMKEYITALLNRT